MNASKVLRAIRALISKPYLIYAVLEQEEYWRASVDKKHGENFQLPDIPLRYFSPEPFPVEPFAFLEGGSLPTDLSLLNALAASIDNCRYFEIGTWRGESAANVAQHASRCVTLNLSKQEVAQMTGSQQYADAHFFFLDKNPKIQLIEANTLDFDFSSLKETFDLVFIDGDHHYDLVKHDTEMVFKHLLHENSIVVWHDYAKNPEIPRPEVMAGILDGVPAGKHRYLYHVSNTLCAIYIPREVESTMLHYPVEPQGYFKVSLAWKS